MKGISNYFSKGPLSSWFAKLFPAAGKPPSTLALQNPVYAKNLEILENRLQGALRFLKKTIVNKQGKSIRLNTLPWYLLIGSSGCGKTTLLAKSNINFILEKHFTENNIKNIPSSETCDWWVTPEAVLVDVPGSYTALKAKKLSLSNKLWRIFLDYLKKYRGKQAVNGVVFAISLAELMDRKYREQLIDNLKFGTTILREKFGPALPFYFVVTKADLIPGFLDFFNDCSHEELNQAWGISLPLTNGNETLADIFSTRFNALIKRLNKQLIWRLHQERNAYAKIFIKDFPLQIERLKEAMADILKAITAKNPLALRGVYLTSATQQVTNTTEHPPHPETIPGPEFQQALQIMHQPSQPQYAFFIKQVLMQAIIPSTATSKKTIVKWHPGTLAATGGAMMAAIFMGNQFYTHTAMTVSLNHPAQLNVKNAHPLAISTPVGHPEKPTSSIEA